MPQDNTDLDIDSVVESAINTFFESRDADAVLAQLLTALPLIKVPEDVTEAHTLNGLLTKLKAPRYWRRVCDDRAVQIEGLLGESSVDRLRKDRLTPKYGVLYMTPVEESVQAAYRAVVDSDLAARVAQLTDIHESVVACVESSRAHVTALSESGTARSIVGLYTAFSSDLVDDLNTISELTARTLPELRSVAARARLRDALAESLYMYEVARRFAETVTARLTAAQ